MALHLSNAIRQHGGFLLVNGQLGNHKGAQHRMRGIQQLLDTCYIHRLFGGAGFVGSTLAGAGSGSGVTVSGVVTSGSVEGGSGEGGGVGEVVARRPVTIPNISPIFNCRSVKIDDC